jgi:hypothetical protein
LELPERARVAKELLVREGVLGVVWRIPPEGYYRVADDIVREFLTQSNENPDTLDREPTFKRLCGSWFFEAGEVRPHEPSVPRVLCVVVNLPFKE